MFTIPVTAEKYIMRGVRRVRHAALKTFSCTLLFMLTAITRAVSPGIVHCELTFVPRQPIDLAKAEQQHGAYQRLLENFVARLISLPAEPQLPDSLFVEDPPTVRTKLSASF